MTGSKWCAGLCGFLLGAAVYMAAALHSTAAADVTTCGTKESPCPLQAWMRANMGTALAASDAPALSKALDHAASLSPDPSWTWAKIAKDGAAAAQKGDMAAAKASCKSCHDAYKDKYKTQFRGRPIS
jgi:hypothetical protein